MKVLMVGATGKYASFIVPELKQRGVTVLALVRSKDKADAAQQRGVDEAAIANLRDPKSLRAAARGVDGVFHINPALAPDEAKIGVAMVEAAKPYFYDTAMPCNKREPGSGRVRGCVYQPADCSFGFGGSSRHHHHGGSD